MNCKLICMCAHRLHSKGWEQQSKADLEATRKRTVIMYMPAAFQPSFMVMPNLYAFRNRVIELREPKRDKVRDRGKEFQRKNSFA
jgi:hypothetical protein